MVFKIRKTSSAYYEPDGFEHPPCDEAYITEHELVFVGSSGEKLYHNTYALKIGSLSDLVALSNKYGEIIINGDTLEIYDDFRE